MSAGKHTKGPWVEFADAGKTIAIMAAGRCNDVATFAAPLPTRADARLIAAAPDLLSALDWILRLYDEGEPVGGEVITRARAARDKAEGRS